MGGKVLRVIEERDGTTPRLLSVRAFVQEVGRLTDEPSHLLREGALHWTVEALDREGRVLWRAHCAGVRFLRRLASELAEEAQLDSRRAGRDG
jgi:hypothetical protein